MIGIRVDANKEIATGHLMRCISIATGLKIAGENCIFISADREFENYITNQGFGFVCLNSVWNSLENEIEKLVEVINDNSIVIMIIDSYYVTDLYLKSVSEYSKIVYIDDLNMFYYPVNMIINYNIYYYKFLYPDIYIDSKVKLLLGCKYVPLRNEFNNVVPKFRNNVEKILITTGGSDNFNISGLLLEKIIDDKHFSNIEFHIIVGKYNIYSNYLEKVAKKKKNIILHKNVKSMSKLMIDCDLAVSAGGITLYELCACGIPSVCLSFADNQIEGAITFAESGFMSYAGDIRDGKDKCISNTISYLCEYIDYNEHRNKVFSNMINMIDGQGVTRIVKSIRELTIEK